MLHCKVCKQQGSLIYDFKFIKLYKCTSCNTVFAGKNYRRLRTEDWGLEQEEFKNYYNKQFKTKYKYYLGILKGLQINPPGFLLDIGCGRGEFLLEAKKRGWKVYGVEPSSTLANFGKKNYKLNIIQSQFNKKYFDDTKFKLVAMLDLLEHTENPRKFLVEVKKILAKDGFIFLTVPNLKSLTSRFCIWVYKSTLGLVKTPVVMLTQAEYNFHHTYYFDKQTLIDLTKRLKFNKVFEETISTIYVDMFFNRKEFNSIPIFLKRFLRFVLVFIQFVEKRINACDTIILVAQRQT